jgi:WD40 repeat protein
VAFSPDGRRLALTADGGVRLYELATGTLCQSFPCDGRPGAIAYSPDGRHLLTAWSDGKWRAPAAAILWDIGSGERCRLFRGLGWHVYDLAFSPDGRRVLCSGNRARIWDLERTVPEHPSPLDLVPGMVVNGLAFSADGKSLVSLRTLSSSLAVEVRTLGTDEVKLPLLFTPFRGEFTGLVSLSNDGRVAAAVIRPRGRGPASEFREVKLWDALSGNGLSSLEVPRQPIRSVDLSSDARRLAVGLKSGDKGTPAVAMWEVPAGEWAGTVRGSGPKETLATLSPDGRMVASRTAGGNEPEPIVLWEVNTGKERLRLPSDGRLHALAFRPDGRVLACSISRWSYSGATPCDVQLWDLASGRLLRELHEHNDIVLALRFSPDGSLLATAGKDETIRLWDTGTGKLLSTVENLGDMVRVLAFSPDGKKLAAGADRIHIWNVAELLVGGSAGRARR